MLRRDKTPLHEQLLAQAEPGAPKPTGRLKAVGIGFAVAGALIALHLLAFIPLIGVWLAPIAIVGVNIWLRRKRRQLLPVRKRSAVSGIRGAFLVWLAVAVGALVLVTLGGFQKDDRILLAVVFVILAALWAGQAATARRRA